LVAGEAARAARNGDLDRWECKPAGDPRYSRVRVGEGPAHPVSGLAAASVRAGAAATISPRIRGRRRGKRLVLAWRSRGSCRGNPAAAGERCPGPVARDPRDARCAPGGVS